MGSSFRWLVSLAVVLALGGGGALPEAGAVCVGDCGGDGEVEIADLRLGVEIALGRRSPSECVAFDRGAGRVAVDDLVAGVANRLHGCQPRTPTPTATAARTPTRTPTMTTELELFDVGANFFSIRMPRGWDIHIAGVCSTLGILIRDPAVPLRQIFYFGLIGPVYLREAQRQIDLDYIHGGGFPFITWLDAPAIDPLTVSNYFSHWPDIAAMEAATDFLPEFPTLTGLTLVSSEPLAPGLPSGDSALLRGVFVEGSAVGQGQFVGTTWVYLPFTGVPGGGIAYGSVILGVTAAKGEFERVEATLVASLESFTVTQGYIDWCRLQQSQLWGAVARAGQTLRETSDLISDAWQERSQASDILAEQGSDALRGVERVYDPASRQVYEVPAGWFTSYDLHRGEYELSDLQLLPDDDLPLWRSAPADGGLIR